MKIPPKDELPDDVELGTIEAACAIMGGDRPLHKATYYKWAKAGIVPAPVKIGPNTSRVNLKKVRQAARDRFRAGESG